MERERHAPEEVWSKADVRSQEIVRAVSRVLECGRQAEPQNADDVAVRWSVIAEQASFVFDGPSHDVSVAWQRIVLVTPGTSDAPTDQRRNTH